MDDISTDTSELDQQIEEVRDRIARLEKEEELQNYIDQRLKEAEQPRKEDEKEKREAKRLEEEAVALQKRCAALKDKKMSDLTINEVEVLKQCGLTIPHLP